MAATPLADFLDEISRDDDLLSEFNGMTVSAADSFLASRGLNEAQRAAVLSRDVTRICAHLLREQPDWGTQQFFIPAGPTMDPPSPGDAALAFAATPQGTMDPNVIDTFTSSASSPARFAVSAAKPVATARGGAAKKRARMSTGRSSAAKKSASTRGAAKKSAKKSRGSAGNRRRRK